MITSLLEQVASASPPVSWEKHPVNPVDIDALREEANLPKNAWDTKDLKHDLWKRWLKKDGLLQAVEWRAGPHRVILLGKDSITPPKVWPQLFELLSPEIPVRVLWFASEEKRTPPEPGKPIEPEHINGGYTQKCNAQSIVIYRKEEATRVLIHELLHAACSDPDKPIAELEADTEAWAEVILCAVAAKGVRSVFDILWKKQATYASHQAAVAEKLYGVKGPENYAWRYLTGRLERFHTFGLPCPPLPPSQPSSQPLTTLRLTCESIEKAAEAR